ncbi:5'-nucleotidase [Parabacteroides sp. PF5-5]|uniref:5'/3'-nucleotidase SurE n=1 Tax=unclassified Parabacteroides TaxID=2649774 RepID=UPI0024740685|nr:MULTISPECIES: 5'/3'-nucleotidase SurE [unclassified Parabacteroides]MDH6307015.1 5'-nucleotidase [Parabacteroides sp. PH5-39]MDH6317930.1 5'-nucleotidase [Parabacteroides sp. PF5-13]MDH6321666.1 5'-nucleotidase [Parabacteroides sp. PH5-13]MDH6325417.1 5'-nucleotidase [Parabacteroides sp. PH5-8]MDH6329118.1 5'-nucleotidase [Parabacteroides sp. PH5-41]
MKDKPLILITNDDGVNAKGIKELTECLRDLGDLVIFAPDGPRSGMSSAITSLIPIKYKQLCKENGLVVYSCTGTPVDCVKLAVNDVLDRKPDLIVSGINHGGNMAICVHYSGTMGAAIEGCTLGIPSIGISLTDHAEDADFSECCRLGRKLARRVLKEGLPSGTYLNLNVPNIPHVKEIKVCQQAAGRFVNEYMRSENASGEAVYWLTGSFENAKPIHPEGDTSALDRGYASLVPCKIDVTDYDYLQKLTSIIND